MAIGTICFLMSAWSPGSKRVGRFSIGDPRKDSDAPSGQEQSAGTEKTRAKERIYRLTWLHYLSICATHADRGAGKRRLSADNIILQKIEPFRNCTIVSAKICRRDGERQARGLCGGNDGPFDQSV
jgi:hypothetical protein